MDGDVYNSCELSSTEQAAFLTTASLINSSCSWNMTEGPSGVALELMERICCHII